MNTPAKSRGFTLIELLTALLILSLLSLLSYRGLGAVQDAREHVRVETEKWRRVADFCERLAQDMRLAAPSPVRTALGIAPAWLGRPGSVPGPRLEFSRFASAEGVDLPRRVAYTLNPRREIELSLWSGLDQVAGDLPARYALLKGVSRFELQYLNAELAWVEIWPAAPGDSALPRAVRLRLALDSGEEIVRIFALNS